MRLKQVVAMLARALDALINASAGKSLRRLLRGAPSHSAPPGRRNGLAISRGRESVTAEVVARIEAEDDALGFAVAHQDRPHATRDPLAPSDSG